MQIDGNFDESEGNRAQWKFDGKNLHEGDVVLRAMSVLER